MHTDTLTFGLESPPERLPLGQVSLFLDLDGTLAPIVERPDAVAAEPRRNALLADLATRLDGRLAVISGRTLDDLDRILERRVVCVAAVHGLVRRDSEGRIATSPPHPGLARAGQALAAFARDDPRLLIEDKALSLALHYRRAPERAREAIDLAEQVAATTGLSLQPGDMVMELRSPGAGKGDALGGFMAEPPFQGSRPVFVGDDLTDEDGFRAARDRGGFGVLVGPERRTAARYRIDGVSDTLAWLERAQ